MKDSTISERFSELHFKNDIGLYYCGERIGTKNHVYGPEMRNHFLFVLVNKGDATLFSESSINFGEHDLLIMYPNETVHYKALSDWSISWVGLYGKTIQEFVDLLDVSPKNPIIHISLYNELKAVLDNIFDACKENSLVSNLQITSLIYEFLSVLMQNSKLYPKTDVIKSALKIIDYNFCSDISIEQIAKHSSFHPAYFSRIFTETVGVSPKQYILQKRINRAKELLSVTDAGILEISNSVGYEDQFYFSRIFKKHTGLSPAQYRKLNATTKAE
ncbi:MAG: AraC family transcriptional regulator [Clostridia bacterium]|nr:AraC family transcriptional regulator [Clostridia bacterium]